MLKFDLNRPDGIWGVGFLGGVIACFIVYMASNIVSKPGIMDTAQFIGLYSMIAGLICLAIGCGLLVINALRVRSTETERIPTWQILIFFCVVGVIILISLLIPALI
ncbi:MAG: hypothetical protein HWN65_12985 [Candidatus Helarchaeota archaeon]|nr:hypothetical protein [Candidatus Helarchaeota archaeon]